MKYKILIAHSPIELSWSVNKNIKMEWRPIGGIAVCDIPPDGTSYHQAMESDGVAEEGTAAAMKKFPFSTLN